MNNKWTTNEQQMDTILKNIKNIKNDKKKKELRVCKDSKKKYKEAVHMTEDEHTRLIERYGEKQTEDMIEILSNYKVSKGKKYKSDYHAILSWVVKAYLERKLKVKDNRPLEERLKNAESI